MQSELKLKTKRTPKPRIEMPKRCRDCGKVKDSKEFYSAKTNGDGLSSRCIPCFKIQDSRPVNRLSRFNAGFKKRGGYCDLTLEQYTDIVSKPCFYCAWPISKFGKGMDRIDNFKQYVMGNVVPCCSMCNEGRGIAYAHEEWKTHFGPAVATVKAERAAKGLPPPEGYLEQVGKRDRKNPKGSKWWKNPKYKYAADEDGL